MRLHVLGKVKFLLHVFYCLVWMADLEVYDVLDKANAKPSTCGLFLVSCGESLRQLWGGWYKFGTIICNTSHIYNPWYYYSMTSLIIREISCLAPCTEICSSRVVCYSAWGHKMKLPAYIPLSKTQDQLSELTGEQRKPSLQQESECYIVLGWTEIQCKGGQQHYCLFDVNLPVNVTSAPLLLRALKHFNMIFHLVRHWPFTRSRHFSVVCIRVQTQSSLLLLQN